MNLCIKVPLPINLNFFPTIIFRVFFKEENQQIPIYCHKNEEKKEISARNFVDILHY